MDGLTGVQEFWVGGKMTLGGFDLGTGNRISVLSFYI